MVTQEERTAATGDPVAAVEDSGLGWAGLPSQWRWLIPVVAGAATAAWLAGVSSGAAHGPARAALMTAGALLTATATGLPLWQQARTARARADAVSAATRARAAMRIAIEDALDPFTALLLQLAAEQAEERHRLRGEALQVALATIARISGLGDPTAPRRRLRACFFALDPGPPRRLVPQSYSGRSGAPTVTFDDSTKAGQVLLRVAADGWMIVDDVDRQRTRVWWDETREYRTFAAGPVPGPAGTALGILTVDGLAPGDLDALDLPLIRLIAHMLGLALQL